MKKLLLLSQLVACLAVPDAKAPECKVTSDCDTANGEICDEGVCYGNPPQGPFAAIVSPPAEHKNDLVSSEIADFTIAADGQLGLVALAEPVTYTGQLHAICAPTVDCTGVPLDATITVTRPSVFPGGPGFHSVVTSDARTGMFSIVVPRTPANTTDTPFTITVVPAGRGDALPTGVTAAKVLPPLRITLNVYDSQAGKAIDLGAPDSPVVDGKITNSIGAGQAQYRVVAIGHWDPGAPPTEVSTVAYTTGDGLFSLKLSDGLDGAVEIVAKPFGNSITQPTLHLSNVSSLGASARSLVVPAMLGQAKAFDIKITGEAVGGEVVPILGARVQVTGGVPNLQPGSTDATVAVEATTTEDGYATVLLLDGSAIANSYHVSVLPPASSTLGVVYDDKLDLSDIGTRKLPNRVAITGIVRGSDGKPAKDVSVTVTPSLRFTWSLGPTPQAFLSAIPAATTTSLESGEFTVFVDPVMTDIVANQVVEVWGSYDVTFEPTAGSSAPTFVLPEIEIPRDVSATTVNLPETTLPDAAHIRGTIIDASGAPVEGSELKVFRVIDVAVSMRLCDGVLHAPAGCPIPALLLGRGASDVDGVVRLTLPRP